MKCHKFHICTMQTNSQAKHTRLSRFFFLYNFFFPLKHKCFGWWFGVYYIFLVVSGKILLENSIYKQTVVQQNIRRIGKKNKRVINIVWCMQHIYVGNLLLEGFYIDLFDG